MLLSLFLLAIIIIEYNTEFMKNKYDDHIEREREREKRKLKKTIKNNNDNKNEDEKLSLLSTINYPSNDNRHCGHRSRTNEKRWKKTNKLHSTFQLQG